MSESPLETPEQDVPAPAEAPETTDPPAQDVPSPAPEPDVPAPHLEPQVSAVAEIPEPEAEPEPVDSGPTVTVPDASPNDVLEASARGVVGADADQAVVDRYIVRNRNHLLPALASTFSVAAHRLEHLFNREVT